MSVPTKRQCCCRDAKACEAAEARLAAKEAEVQELVGHSEWLQGRLAEASDAEPARQARRYEAELARLRDERARREAQLEARLAEEAAARRVAEEELAGWRGREAPGAERLRQEAAALRATLAAAEAQRDKLSQVAPSPPPPCEAWISVVRSCAYLDGDNSSQSMTMILT